jgi:hypothetical protein
MFTFFSVNKTATIKTETKNTFYSQLEENCDPIKKRKLDFSKLDMKMSRGKKYSSLNMRK